MTHWNDKSKNETGKLHKKTFVVMHIVQLCYMHEREVVISTELSAFLVVID